MRSEVEWYQAKVDNGRNSWNSELKYSRAILESLKQVEDREIEKIATAYADDGVGSVFREETHGKLTKPYASQRAKAFRSYLRGFIAREFNGIDDGPDAQNLAMSLDFLEEANAMLLAIIEYIPEENNVPLQRK